MDGLTNLISTYLISSASWPEPNYDNPELAGYYLPGLQYALLALTSLCLIVRLAGRVVLKSVGYDDLFIVIAWVFGVVVTVSNEQAIRWGIGRHIWDFETTVENARGLLLHTWLGQWSAGVSNTAAKLSILFFYRRFAQTRRFRICVLVTIWFVTLWGIATTIPWILRCVPVASWWSIEMEGGKCIDVKRTELLMYIQLALNLVSDILLFLMPISTLWKLQISKVKKAMLIGCLGVGLLCTAFAVMRLQTVKKASDMVDPTWDGYKVMLWQILETQLGIVCACLPFMKTAVMALCSLIYRPSSKPFDSETVSSDGKGIDLGETAASHTMVDDDNIHVTRTWDVEKSEIRNSGDGAGDGSDASGYKYDADDAFLSGTTTTITRGSFLGMTLPAISQSSLATSSEDTTEAEGDNWWERSTPSLGGGLSPRRDHDAGNPPRRLEELHLR